MPSLYKRANGVYYVAFHDANRSPQRKHVSTRTKHKRDADRVRVTLERSYLHGEFDPWMAQTPAQKTEPASEPKAITLREASRLFLLSRSNLTPMTKERYRSIVERFCEHAGPGRWPESITTDDVQGFIASSRTKPITRFNYRRALSTFFKWLVERGDMSANPATAVRLERVPSKHPQYLRPEEVDALCSVVQSQQDLPHVEAGTGLWLIPIIRANVYLGLRAGELVNLKWSDIDLDAQKLWVRNSESFTTKSGKQRTLPLCQPVVRVLEDLERPSEFVFPNHSGGQLHRQYLSRRFKHFVRAAGLNETIHFHTTRHTAASWLSQQGASIEAIRLYMGHSSVTVTQRYMHLAPDALADQIVKAFRGVQ